MDFLNHHLQLPPGEAHLWFCFHDGTENESLNRRYQSLLSDGERRRMEKLYFTHDRHEFLITRALVRTTLSRYALMPPEAWQFGQNNFGRRHLIDTGPHEAGTLSFNVSHTRGLVVLAVTRCAAIGVDAENLGRDSLPNAARRILTPAEAESLRLLPLKRQAFRCFQLWTLKESYIKARGVGVQIPLDQFGFDLDHADGIGLNFDAQLADLPGRWELRQFCPRPTHIASICIERISGVPTTVKYREATPLVWERAANEEFVDFTEQLA